jgi:hypothetical protein
VNGLDHCCAAEEKSLTLGPPEDHQSTAAWFFCPDAHSGNQTQGTSPFPNPTRVPPRARSPRTDNRQMKGGVVPS